MVFCFVLLFLPTHDWVVLAVGGRYLSCLFFVDRWVTHCSFWSSHIFGPVGLQTLLATFTPNLMLQQHKWTALCDKEVLPDDWICLVALVSHRLHAWLAAPRRRGLWQLSQAQLPEKCLAKVVNIFLSRTRSVFVILSCHERCFVAPERSVPLSLLSLPQLGGTACCLLLQLFLSPFSRAVFLSASL